MSDDTHVYDLPGEIAAAIQTNRPELVTMLINKVRSGHVIEQRHVIGILEAFRDVTKMRAEDNQRALFLERATRRLSDYSKGIDKLEEQVRAVCRKLGSGEPLSPEELE